MRVNNNPNTKRRVWFFEFYPDSTVYDCKSFLETVKNMPEYAYILHDKDVNPDTGELKKPHYHVVIRTSPCLLSTILNKFPNLKSNFVEYTHEFRWCLRYLIHLDDITKYQYSPDAIVHNIADIDTYFRTRSEVSYVWEMVTLRMDGKNWYEILKYSTENNCYDVFRRNFNMISAIASEGEFDSMKEVNINPWENE